MRNIGLIVAAFCILTIACTGNRNANDGAGNNRDTISISVPSGEVGEDVKRRILMGEVFDYFQNDLDLTDSTMLMIGGAVERYAESMSIELPKEGMSQLLLDSVCTSHLDFAFLVCGIFNSDHCTDMSDRALVRYFNWKFLQVGKRHHGIDWRREYKEFGLLTQAISALYSDELSGNGGSGAWQLWASCIWLEIGTFHEWWRQILKGEDMVCDTRITRGQFEDEFAKVKQHEFADEKTHADLVENLRRQFYKWERHRDCVLGGISNRATAQTYLHQTRALRRRLFIMLKNRFEDGGAIGGSFMDVLLDPSEASDSAIFYHDYEERERMKVY